MEAAQPQQTPSQGGPTTPDWRAIQKSVEFHWGKAQQAAKTPEKPQPR